MRTNRCCMILMSGLIALAISAHADEDNRLGVGAHYWTTVKNLDIHNVDRHGFSWLASYQYWPSLIGLEADGEWLQSGYAGATKDVYEPQAYLLLGRTLYGAVGIGGYYTDGSWGNKPFYAFRAGLNFELLPRLYLDINADYRFEDWSGLKASDINSDTITLGAAARLAF
jgi:hypothetical protein